jgi:hypothetical protein
MKKPGPPGGLGLIVEVREFEPLSSELEPELLRAQSAY